MAKKKNNTTVVNNIDSVNVVIDYDKLAEAIVKAGELAEKKTEKNNQFYNTVMKVFNWVLYFSIYSISGYCAYITSMIDTDNNMEFVVKILFILMFGGIALIMFVLQFELYKYSPKQIRELFNTNVALVALILAALALLPNKDVENIEVLLREIKSIIENIGIAK